MEKIPEMRLQRLRDLVAEFGSVPRKREDNKG